MSQPCILIIETATPNCSVAITLPNGQAFQLESPLLNDHSSRITLLIESLLSQYKLDYKSIQAVAVSNGPGSYTGLRIGSSTAKGLCFALNIPLIELSTLRIAAESIKATCQLNTDDIIIPLIDARRMEVYSAIYDAQMHLIQEPTAEIVNDQSWNQFSSINVYIGGTGAEKLQTLFIAKSNFHFVLQNSHQAIFGRAEAFEKFNKQQWADLAYCEPTYIKDFVPGNPVVKGLR